MLLEASLTSSEPSGHARLKQFSELSYKQKIGRTENLRTKHTSEQLVVATKLQLQVDFKTWSAKGEDKIKKDQRKKRIQNDF